MIPDGVERNYRLGQMLQLLHLKTLKTLTVSSRIPEFIDIFA